MSIMRSRVVNSVVETPHNLVFLLGFLAQRFPHGGWGDRVWSGVVGRGLQQFWGRSIQPLVQEEPGIAQAWVTHL